MKFAKWNISLVIGFMVLGLLLSTSFYSKQYFEETSSESRKRDLMISVKELEKERERLKNGLIELRSSAENYERRAAANEGMFSSFVKENEELKKAVGLTSLDGPGVEVILADSAQFPETENPNNYIIHDYDLRMVVNALVNGGSEAICINGQRLVSTSAIRCAGNTVMVNSTRLSSPYKIQAIGNPDRLLEILQEDEGFTQLSQGYAKAFGLVVTLDKLSELKLLPYEGSLRLEYVKAMED